MIRIFKTEVDEMKELTAPEKDCWISLVNPNEEELASVSSRYCIDPDDLRAALDEEERARIETEDDYTLILVDIPAVEVSKDKETYVTEPLGIVLAKDAIITVCLHETPILYTMKQKRSSELRTNMRTRFILQILYRNASLYLQYLRIINKKSDMVEQKLHDSTKNRELIALLGLEKSLVYFTTSLRSNETVLEKLLKSERIKKYPEDTDLLEDVIVENRQAIEMANIYSGILSNLMDSYASVISNNLNIVMKFLAIVTIVLSIPAIIFAAYGMNVNISGMPLAAQPYGFAAIIGVSVVITLIVAVYLSKKKMF
ncbi:MAG: Magnesium transport protein CorA [Firmicutes bacterium ADurb.Bin248]|nr:MAG: Magnesium transport protein CorA [Firmicutes bacterium ADurb.Bin248]HOG00053.1 magnesium transporter CorA family protein [Clostridia bacterium]HPK16018.1 magnesium transporter CorA family protein [Clostridia bacterium]